MTDDDKKIEAHQRADKVLQHFGRRAPLPALFESSQEYSDRLARIIQPHSGPYSGVALHKLDTASRREIEAAMYKAAREAGNASVGENSGKLVAIKQRDPSGREVTTYKGDMDSWLSAFKLQPQRIRFRRPRAVGNVIVGLQR